jgi:dTDP-4-amino-4,6-dideoxygalactose transaminase
VCTNDETIAERARQLRNLGQRRKGEHVIAGVNERLDGLQAAFLRVKLPHLDGWNTSRRRWADAYREQLGDDVGLLEDRGASCVYHLFPIRVPDRDALRARLSENGVETGVHYSPALHHQPPFAALKQQAELPVAEAWAAGELSLPIFPELTPREIERVVAACAPVPT